MTAPRDIALRRINETVAAALETDRASGPRPHDDPKTHLAGPHHFSTVCGLPLRDIDGKLRFPISEDRQEVTCLNCCPSGKYRSASKRC